MINDHNILTALLSRLDGLLLSGGIDVHPSRYGEEVHPLTQEVDIELDEFEITLASWAISARYTCTWCLPWHATYQCSTGWYPLPGY